MGKQIPGAGPGKCDRSDRMSLPWIGFWEIVSYLEEPLAARPGCRGVDGRCYRSGPRHLPSLFRGAEDAQGLLWGTLDAGWQRIRAALTALGQ